MTNYPDSTAEILAFRVLDRSADRAWVDWATEMLAAGFYSEHLAILAGETAPFNAFEMKQLADWTLRELELDDSDKERIIRNYVDYLIDQALSGQRPTFPVLATLRDFYFEFDFDGLYDFYLLYYAKWDLLESEVQWYWPNADRSNIDSIIADYFNEWKAGQLDRQPPTTT